MCHGRSWRQLIVRHDADNKDSLAGLDLVAGGEHRLLNPRAIQESAVRALLVDDAAAAEATFDGKMHAGHVTVFGNGKFRAVRRPTDGYGLALRQRNLLAGRGAGLDFEKQAQGENLKCKNASRFYQESGTFQQLARAIWQGMKLFGPERKTGTNGLEQRLETRQIRR